MNKRKNVNNPARLLAVSVVALLVASSCAGGEQDTSVDVLAVAPADEAGEGSDRKDSPDIAEAGLARTGDDDDANGSVTLPGDDAPEPGVDASNADVVDPEAVALAQAAIDNLDGRSIRGEFYLEGALVSDETMGAAALGAQFDTTADGNSALRLGAAVASEVLGLELPTGSEIEVRIIGADAYMSIPVPLLQAQGHDVSGDTRWMVATDELRAELLLTCDTAPSAFADPPDTASQDSTCDPLSAVAGELDLESASSATVEGVEDLRGVAVTRVRVVVPIDALGGDDPSTSEAADDELSDAILGAFGAAGAGVIFEFWVDEDGLARRVVSDVSSLMSAFVVMFGGELDDEVLLRVVVDIYGYDDLTVEAPPEDLLLPEDVVSGFLANLAPGVQPVTSLPGDAEPPPVSALP